MLCLSNRRGVRAQHCRCTHKLRSTAPTRDAKLGRAEALRRAMLALIDKGEPREAHPAYWAPFIVVGEGATR